MTPSYSDVWFEAFLSTDTGAPIHPELEFFRKHLPLEHFPRVLDVACGIGRHSGPLAAAGYEVLGVDLSESALETARKNAPPSATYRHLDMRDLDDLGSSFDVVMCLWASFGFDAPDQNQQVLASMSRRLRSGGRLLLDVYHAEGVRQLPAESEDVRRGRSISTKRSVEDDRFRVEIRYSDSSEVDVFDWQLYTLHQLIEAGATAGLDLLFSCAWFDSERPVTSTDVRMQLLFGIRGSDP